MVLAIAAPLLGGVLVQPGWAADGAPVRDGHAAGVTLRTGAPGSAVVPGRTYEWTFKVTAKGPGKAGRALFWTRLPRSLAFVSGHRDCAAAGWTVVCDLGTVRKGRTVTGAIKARVARKARPGGDIRLRGAAMWGRARTVRAFPAVRVAGAAHLSHSTAAPKKPHSKKPHAGKPHIDKPHAHSSHTDKSHAKRPKAKKSHVKTSHAGKPKADKPRHVKKPRAGRPHVEKPAAVRRTAGAR
ncbi:hypothetical protein GWI34_15675 [Actinomadura sp. DSM 109109]|nr:hypothetical protein [Actinomadura lepetitiana]